MRCLKCSNVFYSNKVLNKHYVDVHNVVLNYQELEFDSIQSFQQWLEKHNQETFTRFIIRNNNRAASTRRLICHRSRDTRSSLTVDSRKRCLKTSGYKRLGGICPAEIRLRIGPDGSCHVKYQTTHVGHNIGDESELKYIYLTNEEKRKIAAEIQSGTPLAQIVCRKRLSRSSGPSKNLNRLDLVTRQDVRNIAISQNLVVSKNCESALPGCNPVDLEAKIAEHEDDIVFCKKQAEEDCRFNILEEDDFVLVVMTSNQKSYLRTYGHKVICFDATYNTSLSGFSLYSLLVLDIHEEGLPGAFLLTNRDDQCVMDIFLACVRDCVGILEPHTLITSMQTTFYDSWIKIMNSPTYYLFCTWQVHEAWKKHFGKIANKKKREDVLAELIRLSYELDPIKFETGLNSLLSDDDDELVKFQRYFQKNYSGNTARWAYCYRTMAGVNANAATKSFRRSFKNNLTSSDESQPLTQCLAFIFDYLILLETNIFEKNVRGKVTSKLSMLRNRHQEAFNQYKEDAFSRVIAINSDMFMVQSFENADSFYTISRLESKECDRDDNASNNFVPNSCRLVCDWCNLCYHSFHCTCEDRSLKSNMCKHIHLIGLYLRDQPSDGLQHSSSVEIEDQVLESTIIVQESKYSELVIEAMEKLPENRLNCVHNKMITVLTEADGTETDSA